MSQDAHWNSVRVVEPLKFHSLTRNRHYLVDVILDTDGTHCARLDHVCTVLGYDSRNGLPPSLRPDEVVKRSILTSSGPCHEFFLTQSGFFKVAMRGDSQVGIEFQDFVARTVIPQWMDQSNGGLAGSAVVSPRSPSGTGSNAVVAINPDNPLEAVLQVLLQTVRKQAAIESQVKAIESDQSQVLRVAHDAKSTANIAAKTISHHLDHFSIAGWASDKGISLSEDEANVEGRYLSDYCRKNHIAIKKCDNSRWRSVNAYHRSALDWWLGDYRSPGHEERIAKYRRRGWFQ